MKRTFLSLLATGVLTAAIAQDGNNICVWNAMNTYNTGGGAEDLERAIKCTDEAAVNPSTAEKSKTWFYRGELYTLIFLDKNLKTKYPNSSLEASKAFKKLLDLNDPKFRDWEEVFKHALPLGTATFNEGVEMYNAKNYAQAYQYFYSIKDINTVLSAKGKQGSIDLATALKNAATCAELSGNAEGALNVYKDWIAVNPEANAYRGLAMGLKKQGKKEESQKVIDEALVKYPKDQNLLIEKLNFYLEDQKYVDALGYLNSLIEIDPNNGEAYFIKALTYENEKIRNEDSVIYYYNKAIEVNKTKTVAATHSKPYNNLGALYVKKGNEIGDQMNKLGMSSADQKKYDELAAKQKEWFEKAIPMFEKAKELDPSDALISKNLNQMKMKLGK